jgi:hypothetical protein
MYDWCRDVIALRKYIYITKILIYIFFEYFYIKIKKKSKIIKKKKLMIFQHVCVLQNIKTLIYFNFYVVIPIS